MLNLNYNINKAIGGGGCIGVMKYNYSASILVVGGGGGGGNDTNAGGGGGGGMAVSQSISIVPNVLYTINVGGGGAIDTNGQDSNLIGFDDRDDIPIQFSAQGGKKGEIGSNPIGGNSGSGSIVRAGVVTSYPAFTGGTAINTATIRAGGGGAGNSQNGGNGSSAGNIGTGGNGANGPTSTGGGGGGFSTTGTHGPNGVAGGAGAPTIAGGGGNGKSIQIGARAASAGGTGAVTIIYSGQTKATVTNATTTFLDGFTTHSFNSGSGTFIYTFPFPWAQPATPYQVEECPPQKDGFAPYIYNDPYSASIVSAIPGAVFKQGYDNLFGATNIWDDISSYVRGNGNSVGSSRTITPSGSGTIVSASSTPWDIYGYPSSLLFSSNSLLNAGTDSGTFEGFNIPSASFSPSGSNFNWAAECWVAVPVSSSFILPNRSIVRKNDSYGLNLFSGINNGDNVWQNNGESKYLGPLTASLTMNVVDTIAASELIYQANGTMGASGSNDMTAFQWHHIAFSSQYIQCDATSSIGTHTIYRGFFDGREIFAAPINMCGFVERIPKYPTPQAGNPALIFGDLFGDTPALMQDFRFYKGTNKNYTASFDVNDVYPIVVGRPY